TIHTLALQTDERNRRSWYHSTTRSPTDSFSKRTLGESTGMGGQFSQEFRALRIVGRISLEKEVILPSILGAIDSWDIGHIGVPLRRARSVSAALPQGWSLPRALRDSPLWSLAPARGAPPDGVSPSECRTCGAPLLRG